MMLLVMATVAGLLGAVKLSANDRKMPLAVAEPEFATATTPIVFALKVPLTERSNGEPAPGVAICNVIALPFASRIVLFETLKVNVPPDAIVTPPPPTLLFGWLFDNVFGWPAEGP